MDCVINFITKGTFYFGYPTNANLILLHNQTGKINMISIWASVKVEILQKGTSNFYKILYISTSGYALRSL